MQTSQKLRATISPVIEVISTVLQRGRNAGEFRSDVDALDFYVTLIGMGYYVASNRFTINAFTGRGTVPFLSDGSIHMTESAAICQ